MALPSSLLAYLALRGVRNDQALFERGRRAALPEAASRVIASFENRLARLEHHAGSASGPPDLPSPLVDAGFAIT